MTRVRLEDLPPKMREKVLAGEVEGSPPVKRVRPASESPNSARSGAGPRYRCHACGAEFDHWGVKVERHADENHHHRLDAILS